MIVIFIGDIVGAAAVDYLIERLPELRERHRADLVVANAENCAPNGLGTTEPQLAALFDAGVDLITGGNHSWDSPESIRSLAHPKVLRPFNVAPEVPGHGCVTVEVAGEPVTVLNLADGCAMKSVRATKDKVRPAYTGWTDAERVGTVLVDYHGDHVLEKQIFAHTVDGQAAAVLGTHTHEATTALHLLPGGTALVTEVGMTGPSGGVQGFASEMFAAGMRESGNPFALGIPPVIEGPIVLGAVVLEIDNGRTTRLERLS